MEDREDGKAGAEILPAPSLEDATELCGEGGVSTEVFCMRRPVEVEVSEGTRAGRGRELMAAVLLLEVEPGDEALL